MTLDNNEQKELLLNIISSISISGQVLDAVYDLKQKIMTATIQNIANSDTRLRNE